MDNHQQIQAILDRSQALTLDYQGHVALWEVSILRGDGITEERERAHVLSIVEQMLDCRQHTLQLSKLLRAK